MKKTTIMIYCLIIFSAIHCTCSSKTILTSVTSNTDSINNVDKKNIVKKVVHEVFSNYLDSILFYKKNFNSNSVMTYIDSYIKRQNDNIETKISDKSYIDRFGITEKSWIITDFKEVATMIKVQTLDRIKEISADVDIKVLNTLNTTTNDKEALLEKEVRDEIKD